MNWIKLVVIFLALVGTSLQAETPNNSQTEPDFIDKDGEVIQEVMLSEAAGSDKKPEDKEAEEEADIEIEAAAVDEDDEDEEGGAYRKKRAPLNPPRRQQEKIEEELKELEDDVSELNEEEDIDTVQGLQEKMEELASNVLVSVQDIRNGELEAARSVYIWATAIVLVVILILVILLGVCIHKRRKATKRLSEEEQPLDGAIDAGSRRSSKRSFRGNP